MKDIIIKFLDWYFPVGERPFMFNYDKHKEVDRFLEEHPECEKEIIMGFCEFYNDRHFPAFSISDPDSNIETYLTDKK